MLNKGDILEDRYFVNEVIEVTQNSNIYLATDLKMKELRAIKETKPESNLRDVAIREASILKSIQHPFVPRVFDTVEHAQSIEIIMDYIEGDSLEDKRDANFEFSEELVVKIAKDIAHVLLYIHNKNPKIIYRDIKPDNIIMQKDGSIRLIDFGIALKYREDGLPEESKGVGTEGYAAPEQYGTDGYIDERTDVYSLGVMMYVLLTKQDAIKSSHERHPITYYNENFSTGLSKVIAKATKSNPDERYQSAAEFLAALNNYPKYDDDYIAEKKKQKRIIVSIFSIAAVLIVLSVFFIGKSYIETNNAYKKLINMPDKESYITAIQLIPTKPDAYSKLIDSYTEFSVDDGTEFLTVYGTYGTNIKVSDDERSAFYMKLAEKYLVEYDTQSTRERLLLAKPFLEKASSTQSKAYIGLLNMIEEYVVGNDDNELAAKEISDKEVKSALDKIDTILSNVKKTKSNNRNTLIITSTDICTGALNSIISGSLDKSTLKDVNDSLSRMILMLEKTDPTNETLKNKKDETLEQLEALIDKNNGVINESNKKEETN
jgi:serine/threonine-protein kinase